MARIRTIKPEFWSSPQVIKCSRDARLLFIGLWNFCDDAGRHKASAERLKMEVFPGDAEGDTKVTQWVRELIKAELLIEYEIDGELYWEVTGWTHQRIDQPHIRYPSPTGEFSQSVRRLGGKQRQLALENLIERDGELCCKCGAEKGFTIGYVEPRSKGGTNDLANLVLLCKLCSGKKGQKVTRRGRAGDAQVTRPRNGMEWNGMEGSSSCTALGKNPSAEPKAVNTKSTVMVFPCTGDKGKQTWALSQGRIDEYKTTYPGLDVLQECRNALQWCRDNATKRKTKGGMGRFLTNWMIREQNAGRRTQGGPAAVAVPEGVLPAEEAWKAAHAAMKSVYPYSSREDNEKIINAVPEPARTVAREIGWNALTNSKLAFVKRDFIDAYNRHLATQAASIVGD